MSRPTNGLEYSLLDGGVAVLVGIGYCNKEHIVVPETISGFTVVGVAEKAFFKSSDLKSIVLPSSVKFIEDQAFAWCSNLEEVIFDGILEIGNRSFIGCDKLKLLSFSNVIEFIGEKAFAYCPSLVSLTIPESVISIGQSAFEGCRSLVSVNISENVRLIENGTFYACTSLRSVTLPRRLEYIDEYAFAYCSAVTDMIIPKKTVVNSDAFFESGNLCRNGFVS